MNQVTKIMNTPNIQTYDVHAFKVREVFDKYGIITSYPIDRNQFVSDLLKACTLSNTITQIFDSEGNVTYYRSLTY